MDSEKFVGSGALCIEKLSDGNYKVWKQKFGHVLAYCKVDVVVFEENRFPQGSFEFAKWKQCDKMVRAIICLSLSDDMLEHVRVCLLAGETLQDTKDVFQRHTFFNKLQVRLHFYTVEMKQN